MNVSDMYSLESIYLFQNIVHLNPYGFIHFARINL